MAKQKVTEECAYVEHYPFKMLAQGGPPLHEENDIIVTGGHGDARKGALPFAKYRQPYIDIFDFHELQICDIIGNREDLQFAQRPGDVLRAPVEISSSVTISSAYNHYLLTFRLTRSLTGSSLQTCNCTTQVQKILVGGAGLIPLNAPHGTTIFGQGTATHSGLSCSFPPICGTIPIYANCFGISHNFLGWFDYQTSSHRTVQQNGDILNISTLYSVDITFAAACIYTNGVGVCRGGPGFISAAVSKTTDCTTPGQIGASISGGSTVLAQTLSLPSNWQESIDEDGQYLGLDLVNYTPG